MAGRLGRMRRTSGLCCAGPYTSLTRLLYGGAKVGGIFFNGSNTRTGRYTVGYTHGCTTRGGKGRCGAVVALGGDFRKEAVAALTTAKRSAFRGSFLPLARNFVCTATGSVTSLARGIVGGGVTTVVFRYIRNRNNILPLRRDFMGTVFSLTGRCSVLAVTSRIRANGNEAKDLCTFVGCNILPSVMSATGKLKGNLPLNTAVLSRGMRGILATNARNSAFNKGPMTYTNTVDIVGHVSSGLLDRIGRGSSCVFDRLRGTGNIGDIDNVKLVVNVRARGSTDRIVGCYVRGNILPVGTGAGIELLPTLGVN